MLKKYTLCILFPKISAYRNGFNETKFSLIKDDELLENHNKICRKVKNIIKKEFDSESVYNEKYLKAKIKSYNGKINTNFHNNKISKKGLQFLCLSVILIDSVFRTGKKFLFLEERKYVIKEKKIPKYIIDDIEVSSDSNEENSAEKILMKKLIWRNILMKKILVKKINFFFYIYKKW